MVAHPDHGGDPIVIGLFTGQATALAVALPAAFVSVMAFGNSRYRDGS